MEPTTAIKAGTVVWKLAKPITRIKQKLNKRRARLGKPLLDINQQEDAAMIAGALKSKTVWLGIATSIWGAVQVFLQAGDFSTEAIVSLATGVVIIVLRAVTTKPLAEK